MIKLNRLVFILACLILGSFFVSANTIYASSSLNQAIVQSYATDSSIQQGMIVGLDKAKSNQVVPLSFNDLSEILGVAVSASAAPITLTGSGNTSQIYVATSGNYNVLVSNQNGPISVGDYISISSLDGIGMKAESSESTILGRAAANFTGSTGVVSNATVAKNGGGTINVAIGTIPVNLSIMANPTKGSVNTPLPGFIQSAADTIANKKVSAPQIYISILILLATVLLAGSLMYSGVKSGITSIGRNPLARKSIIKSLLQIVLIGLIILIIGLFAVYLLLRI